MKLVSENITFSWNKGKLLSDVSLEIEDGSVATLSGDVASGKSTLLFALSGLLVPDSGKVYCSGNGVSTSSSSSFTGLIRQEIFNQIAFTTSEKELRFSASLAKGNSSHGLISASEIAKEWTINSKKTFDMDYYELLKLFTAGFCMTGKKFILFDEVFINLTENERKEMTEKLLNHGIGCLYVTQFPSFFKNITKKHYFLEKGGLTEDPELSLKDVTIERVQNIFTKPNYFKLDSNNSLIKELKSRLKKKGKISFLPQCSERLFFYRDIGRELAWRRIDRDLFLKMAQGAGFPDDIIGADPFTLSSGQRRAIAICLALSRNPEIIFIENPLLHLDAKRIKWFMEELETYTRSGGSVFYTSPKGLITTDLPESA
ncbi:ATP-binding cassette domain-containing protein [candidate division WOR-3 bacterium]|nr:ATP-binding cassette domain-containing protein [candidate division WOR-3 bacterium]